eukprot:2350313-Rhodomonas_salina.1
MALRPYYELSGTDVGGCAVLMTSSSDAAAGLIPGRAPRRLEACGTGSVSYGPTRILMPVSYAPTRLKWAEVARKLDKPSLVVKDVEGA